MTDEELLRELRTIRTLLTLDKEYKLQEIFDDINRIQESILDELSYDEWRRSQEFQSEIADEFDVSQETVRKRMVDLVDKSLLVKQGTGGGIKYRKSGLLRAARMVVE